MTKKAKQGPASDDTPPGARALASRLGDSHAAFRALTRRPGAKCEWKRYSRKAPWALRVFQGERTLFYASPGDGEFTVTVVLGNRAAEAALAGRVRTSLHEAIRTAKVYAEGRPVRVTVREVGDLEGIDELIAAKLKPDAQK